MQLDDLFPIDDCSQSLRAAILAEFYGRCPTVRQVLNIPDARWLSTPGIGRASLKRLHQITQGLLESAMSDPRAAASDQAEFERVFPSPSGSAFADLSL
jgi:hypothetical protein